MWHGIDEQQREQFGKKMVDQPLTQIVEIEMSSSEECG
jgi:hypothetical protein